MNDDSRWIVGDIYKDTEDSVFNTAHADMCECLSTKMKYGLSQLDNTECAEVLDFIVELVHEIERLQERIVGYKEMDSLGLIDWEMYAWKDER